MFSAAIAGATGLTGHYTLNRLLDDGGFDPISALLRTPMHRTHPSLRERVVSFDDLSGVQVPRLDVAFCCLGTTIRKAGSKQAFRDVDYGYTMAFARWAQANGAKHFLCQSSVGADPDSGNFYLKVKGETERDLSLLGFPWLDIFQPGILLGNRNESRPMERLGQVVIEAMEWAFAGPLERYRGVPASRVGAAMAARAKTPGDAGLRRWEWRGIMELSG